MGMFRQLGRAYLTHRLLNRRSRGRYGRSPYYARQRGGRGGFFGPFPYYSGRTRRGTQVRVTGCCLPIPLGLLAALAVGARLLLRS
jgi:hypothetical protein